MAYLYLAKNNKPQVFAAVEERQGDLMPPGVFQQDGFAVGLKQQGGGDIPLSEAHILKDDAPPSGASSAAGVAGSSQAYDLAEVMRWLAVLDEIGDGKLIDLLTFYHSLGASEFRVEVADLWDATDWDGYHLKNTDQRHENAALPCIIQIDDDFPSAVHAAQALAQAIMEVRTSVWRSNFNNTGNPIADYYAMFGRMGVALDNAATAGQIGLGLLNEAGDWVLTVPEIVGSLQDGKYKQATALSAAMIIPFLASTVIKKGIGLKIRGRNGEIIEMPDEVLEALATTQSIARNSNSVAAWRIEAFKVLGPLLQSGQMSREMMKKLLDLGFFKVTKGQSYYYLQKLHKTSGNPNLIGHHDLPIAIEFEENFLLAGLDPNDFGRPVDSGTHAKWHDNKDVASGGAFNAVWREFFSLNEDATAQQILAHLNRIRNGDTFRVDLSNGTSKDFSFK